MTNTRTHNQSAIIIGYFQDLLTMRSVSIEAVMDTISLLHFGLRTTYLASIAIIN